MTQIHRRIAAISPSGIHDMQKLTDSIALVESWGHSITTGRHHDKRHLYTAGTQTERLHDLQWAIESDEVDMIWFIRGGYGTAQLLDTLQHCSKPIVGFSDATALLAHGWNQGWKQLYHGPVLYSLASLCDPQSQQKMRHWLANDTCSSFNHRYAFGPTERIKAPLVGGNLCVLASLCGTPAQLQADGCILALEDIAEPLYKIDRMLLQLEQSGVFKGVRGILMGSYHKCLPPNGASYSLLDVFQERLGHLNIPVYLGAEFGHHQTNWIWKLGQQQSLFVESLS